MPDRRNLRHALENAAEEYATACITSSDATGPTRDLAEVNELKAWTNFEVLLDEIFEDPLDTPE